MCLILFAYGQSKDYPLIVISNRDEFYARPTRSAHWWEDSSDTFGGRDLEAQGTWMGVNRQGRFAAVTNVRELGQNQLSQRSRGDLTREFLTGSESVSQFLAKITSRQDDYAGFNLLIGDVNQLWSYSNRQPSIQKLTPGFHGVSNGLFGEPGPKLTSGIKALEQTLFGGADDDALIEIMASRQQAPDALLPTTGMPLEKERQLSSRFVQLPDYGTRASTLIKFSNQSTVSFTEQTFNPETNQKTRINETFSIQS